MSIVQTDRELRILVGVIAEKRKSVSVWADDYWIPVAVIAGDPGLKEGDVMLQTQGMTRYYMGVGEIYCHARETEAYVHNFESAETVVYVVLRRDDEDNHPLPWFVHTVTASPYEAQDYSDSSEDIVERVAMPPEILDAIDEFTSRHHVEETFRKRKRDRVKIEDLKFGKEPIFLTDRQKKSGNWDG